MTTSDACVALLEDGSLRIWGKANKSEKEIPEMDGEIVSMFAGRYHITTLTDKGTVYSWEAMQNTRQMFQKQQKM